MDARNAFKVLGFGAKFNLKRFKNDAAKLKVFNNLPTSEQTSQETEQSSADSFLENDFEDEDNLLEFDNDDVGQEIQDLNGSQAFRWTKDFVQSNGENNEEKKRKKRKTKAEIIKQQKEEEVAHFRKQHKIYIWGSDIPDPCPTFDHMIDRYNFVHELTETMKDLLASWTPTPIQMQAIPIMLQRRDILASAPTGSGKTLAFVIPLLQHLRRPRRGGFRAVIIEPTRELAKQTYREILRFGEKLALRAHMITKLDIAEEKFGPDILVSTPNRLVHLLNKDPPGLDLSMVKWLIIDESDKLFEAGIRGFRDQLAIIFRSCNNARCRRAFFSATFSYDVEQWCKTYLDNVAMVSVGARNSAVQTIEQEIMFVGSEYGKIVALRNLFSRGLLPPILIFVQTKDRAQQLFSELIQENMKVDVIHAQRDRKEREKVVKRFRKGQIWILICTELMGRGMDFKNVNVVINYDFPPTAISYIHRIGRTGRAGKSGRAITFFTERDRPLLRSIANVMREAGCPTPDYMLELKKPSKRARHKLLRQCVERPEVKIIRRDQRKRKASSRGSQNGKTKKRKLDSSSSMTES